MTILQRCVIASLLVHLLLLLLFGLIVVTGQIDLTAEPSEVTAFVSDVSPEETALRERLRSPFSKVNTTDKSAASQKQSASARSRRATSQASAAPSAQANATSKAQAPAANRTLTEPAMQSPATPTDAPQLTEAAQPRVTDQEVSPNTDRAQAARQQHRPAQRTAETVKLTRELSQPSASSMAAALQPSSARDTEVQSPPAPTASQAVAVTSQMQPSRLTESEPTPTRESPTALQRAARPQTDAKPQRVTTQVTPTDSPQSTTLAHTTPTRAPSTDTAPAMQPSRQAVTVSTASVQRLTAETTEQTQASAPTNAARHASQAQRNRHVDIMLDAPTSAQPSQTLASQQSATPRNAEALTPTAQVSHETASSPMFTPESVTPLKAAQTAEVANNAPAKITTRLSQTSQTQSAQTLQTKASASQTETKQTLVSAPASSTRNAAPEVPVRNVATQTAAATVTSSIGAAPIAIQEHSAQAVTAPGASRSAAAHSVTGEAKAVAQQVAASAASQATAAHAPQSTARATGTTQSQPSTNTLAQRVAAAGASAMVPTMGQGVRATESTVAGATAPSLARHGNTRGLSTRAMTLDASPSSAAHRQMASTLGFSHAAARVTTLAGQSARSSTHAPAIEVGSMATGSSYAVAGTQSASAMPAGATARRQTATGHRGPRVTPAGTGNTQGETGSTSLASLVAVGHSRSSHLALQTAVMPSRGAAVATLGMLSRVSQGHADTPSARGLDALGFGNGSKRQRGRATNSTGPKGTGNVQLHMSGPRKVYVGRTMTYKLNVINAGDGDAVDTVVEDVPPQGVSVESISEGGVQEGDRIVWNLGTLKPRESRQLSVKVRGESMTELSNHATVRAAGMTPVATSATTEVFGIPAILLEVGDADDDDPAQLGNAVRYTITASNQGTIAGRDIVIRCLLEEAQVFVSANGATEAIADGNIITFAPVASLPPEGKARWQVTVRATKPGDIRFQVEMTESQLTRPVTENEATTQYE